MKIYTTPVAEAISLTIEEELLDSVGGNPDVPELSDPNGF